MVATRGLHAASTSPFPREIVSAPMKSIVKPEAKAHVNGELRQSWNTNDFIFNTQQIIAYISRHWTLEPGDIIFTGTPHGVILGYPKDKQVWLKAGDEIVSTIEKLGELKFRLG